MKEMTAKEIEMLIREGEALKFIDVREDDEVVTGKIPGAIHMPLGLVGQRMHELDKSEKYIMVCHSGGRSGRATEFLDSAGYNVVNMEDGMLAWEGKVE